MMKRDGELPLDNSRRGDEDTAERTTMAQAPVGAIEKGKVGS